MDSLDCSRIFTFLFHAVSCDEYHSDGNSICHLDRDWSRWRDHCRHAVLRRIKRGETYFFHRTHSVRSSRIENHRIIKGWQSYASLLLHDMIIGIAFIIAVEQAHKEETYAKREQRNKSFPAYKEINAGDKK